MVAVDDADVVVVCVNISPMKFVITQIETTRSCSLLCCFIFFYRVCAFFCDAIS